MVGYLVGDDLDKESSVFISLRPGKGGPQNGALHERATKGIAAPRKESSL